MSIVKRWFIDEIHCKFAVMMYMYNSPQNNDIFLHWFKHYVGLDSRVSTRIQSVKLGKPMHI